MIACRTRWAHPAQINNGCWNSYTRNRELFYKTTEEARLADLCGAFFDVIFVVGTSRLNNGETYSGLRNGEMVQPNQRIRVHSASGRRQGCVRSHLGGRTCGIKQLERRHSPRIRSCFQQRQRGCGKSKGEIAISAHRKPRSGGVLFCCHTRIVRRRDACLIELGIGWRWAARERPKKPPSNIFGTRPMLVPN